MPLEHLNGIEQIHINPPPDGASTHRSLISNTSMGLMYVDEAGFELKQVRQHGWIIVIQRATVDVPSPEGVRRDITICAAIAEHVVIYHAGPCNTDQLRHFLDGIYNTLFPEIERWV